MKTRLYKVLAGIVVAIYLSSMALSGVVLATPQQVGTQQFPSAGQEPQRGINPETGKVSFIGGGAPVQVPGVSVARGVLPQARAMGTVNAYAREFGLKNPSQELKLLRANKDDTGNDLIHYQQTYNEVPILAGEMIVNMNSNGELLSISGEVSSDLALDTHPAIPAKQAAKTALAEIAKLHQLKEAQLTASNPELWIFDESLLHASARPAELVWRMEVSASGAARPVREMVLVNAQTGTVSLHINEIDTEVTRQATSQAVSQIQYADLVVDEARGKLYGSDKDGNKVDIINISDLSVTGSYSLTAGALPTGLDLSPDGNELAVAQSGLAKVKFINLTNGAKSEASLLTKGGNGEDSLATDVIYGRSGILYVLSSQGLHVMDVSVTPHSEDTTQFVVGEVPFMFDERSGAISSDKNTLYYVTGTLWSAYNGIDKYDVSLGLTSPVLLKRTHIPETGNERGLKLSLINDATLLTTTGTIYKTATMTPKAKNGQKLFPGIALPNRSFYVTGYDNPAGTDLLYFFDKKISYLVSVLNTGVSGTLGALAVTSDGSTLFVSSTGGMTKFNIGTTPPGAAVSLPKTMKQYRDFAFDMPRGVIYGTDASNRVDVISQGTGKVVNSYLLPNGANPMGIDLSPNGNELAIALNGLGKILFLNPTTGAAIAEVTPQLIDNEQYLNKPFDVIYGRTGRLYSDGRPSDGQTDGSDYIHVIDTSAHSWISKSSFDELRTGAELAITSDKKYLYANETVSPNILYGYDIRTDTVSKLYQSSFGTAEAMGFTISPNGGKVFTSSGQVWSGDLQTQLGTLQGAPAVVPFGGPGYVIKFIPGKNAIALTVENKIKFISSTDYHLISTYVSPYAGTILEMEVAPDGSELITNSEGGIVSILSLATFPPPPAVKPTPSPAPTPAPGTFTVKRRTYTNSGSWITLPGSLLCTESKTVCTNGADPDADNAHRYAADTFLFYQKHHKRNSFDNRGSRIISTVRYGVGYQNAFWDGHQMAYGDGMAADDVVGHELTHAVTQYTSNLIYSYQSGAINESFSDVWGEFIDQTNGSGNDALSVKWLLGEDTALGAIRSMSDPTIFGDPDKMSSPYYYYGSDDNGGVHFNSGVNNKAAFLMTDGGTFNDRTITGIGLNKTAAVYYEVQVHLLTSGANYNDLYYALVQACGNLKGGTSGITQNDCNQVKAAAEAVEMIPTPPAPTSTPARTPTRTLTPTTSTLTFTAVADARVSQASPTTNYGTATTLLVDGSSGAAQSSYIRFTASGISGSIQNVRLRVYCTTNGSANGPAAYLANSNWVESGTGGVNWNTRPALLGSGFDNKGTIGTNSWVEYDVTALVTGDGTYTFALIADGNDGVTFSSRQGTAPPQLVVTFGP